MAAIRAPRADEFIRIIRERLPAKTFNHSVSVAEHLLSFADMAGIGDDQAAAAGLLHDLCKPMKGEQLLEAADDYGIEPTELQRQRPTLLHGPVAAEECRRSLGVSDDEVYDAIYWHTTGRPDWCRVGLALYVADFSEPNRTLPEAAEARKMIRRDGFEPTLCFVVEAKVDYVARKHTLDPMTRDFANWIRETFAR